MGEWSYSSTILDLDTRWRLVVSFTPRPLYPWERSPCTHWMRDWVDRRGGLEAVEKRKMVCPCRESNPGRPTRSALLYRLSYLGLYKLLRTDNIRDRLCGLVSGYRSRGPGFDSRSFQIFWEAACLLRGPLSLVRTTEELLGRKSSSSGQENQD
jgi:hypothetical protein